MTKDQPLVSIIIPHWNGIEILSECIDSLLKTNYGSYEIIISDNASDSQPIATSFLILSKGITYTFKTGGAPFNATFSKNVVIRVLVIVRIKLQIR